LHEDLKINIHHGAQRERLAQFILKTCIALNDIQLLGYVEYYLTQFPSLYELVKDQVSEFRLQDQKEQIIPVPQLYVFIQSRLKGSSQLQMPIYFDNTRRIIRVYEALLGNLIEPAVQGRKPDYTRAHDSLKGIEYEPKE